MRKINLLQQPVSSDPKLQELFTELSDTRFALASRIYSEGAVTWV